MGDLVKETIIFAKTHFKASKIFEAVFARPFNKVLLTAKREFGKKRMYSNRKLHIVTKAEESS